MRQVEKILCAVFAVLSLQVEAQLANPEYYTLYHGTQIGTQLIDSDGTVLHSWDSNLFSPSASTAYLREDGLLLRSGQRGGLPGGFLAGSFGTLQLVTWDGDVVWEFDLQEQGETTLHHDMVPMPNGNILATVWDFVSANEMETLGWQPVSGVSGVWMERIIEIEPNLVDGSSEIVWSWELRNHLVQGSDSSDPNFGVVSAEVGKVDINFNAGIFSGDYFHISGIDFNSERDEIVLCPNNTDELWVIDHSTTTAEAATSQGGNRGRGGELIYRWGNTASYDGGGLATVKFLERAHDPRWLFSSETEAWTLTVHNNDRVDNDPGDNDSQVLQLALPIDEDGDYSLPAEGVFAPSQPEVLYEIDPADPFFSTPFMGGAQVLRNGNILITLPLLGDLVEVDQTGSIVWEAAIAGSGFIFKSQNYPTNYSGYGPSLPFNYNVWRAAHFGGVGSVEGESGEDPDEDGRVNLVEYYLGSGPQEEDPVFNLEVGLSGTGSEKALRVTYLRRANVNDVRGRFEFSRILGPWLDESASIDFLEDVVLKPGSQEEVSFEVDIDADEERGFVRVGFEFVP